VVQKLASVVLGLDSPEWAEEVMDFLDRTGRARVVATASDPLGLARAVRERAPNAVVAQAAMARAAGSLDGSALLAVSTAESVEALRDALSAGARGFFVWPADRGELARAAAEAAPPPGASPAKRATIIAVHGPRGGAGATFIATHLSAALARQGHRTVIVDLDPFYGDLSAALGVPPEPAPRTIVDLVPVADELSERQLDDALWQHPEGFGVLLAPAEAPAFDAVGALTYSAALSVLQASADVVVLHPPRGFDRLARLGMEAADRILVVVSLDVLSFRCARRSLEALDAMGLGGRCDIVVNRSTRAEIVPADVEHVFGRKAAAVVRSDRSVGRAQDRGALLPARSVTLRPLARLARSLMPAAGVGGDRVGA
jgi:Flp pilus assembly CpaE family ATPase